MAVNTKNSTINNNSLSPNSFLIAGKNQKVEIVKNGRNNSETFKCAPILGKTNRKKIYKKENSTCVYIAKSFLLILSYLNIKVDTVFIVNLTINA